MNWTYFKYFNLSNQNKMECYFCNASLKRQIVTLKTYHTQTGEYMKQCFCDEDCMNQQIRDASVDIIKANLKGNQETLDAYIPLIRSGDIEEWVLPLRRVFLARVLFYKGLLARKPKAELKKILDIVISKTQEAFDYFDDDDELKGENPLIHYDLGKSLMPLRLTHLKANVDAWGL